jgi:hypothetical protein
MTVFEICCPNCSSPSVKKDGTDYCCCNCGRFFQVVNKPKRESKSKVVVNQQLKYGKTVFSTGKVKSVGNFTLNPQIQLIFNMYQVFRFHVFKQIKRGDTIVKADIGGYFFANPLTGKLTDIQYTDGGHYPHPNEIKNNNLERECIRIINDNAVEDKPSTQGEDNVTPPQMIDGVKIHQEIFDWLTNNFTFKKGYSVQAQGYDSGFREANFTFKKKDILELDSLGVFAVPVFHLSYLLPNSSKHFRRDYLGYSGELVLDELKCSKTKILDRTCQDFPNNVCVACGKLVCDEHTKVCEKCLKPLCKECAISKGLISKHYFCSNCA